MFAALAVAVTVLFQPFHLYAIGLTPEGKFEVIVNDKAYADRAACEKSMAGAAANLTDHGDVLMTPDGPAEVVAMYCHAEGWAT